MTYDLLVIGNDADGLKRAISAARAGSRVAVVELPNAFPALDLLREAADQLADQRPVTMGAWRTGVARLARSQMASVREELDRVGVELMIGEVRFVSSTSVEISNCDATRLVSAPQIVISCGTTSWCPRFLRCDGRFVLGIESLLDLEDLPASMVVVGAGATGLATAILLAKLGVEVVVVDEHVSLLEVCGMFDGSFDAVQSLDIAFRLGDEVIGTELRPDQQAAVRLASGRVLVADGVLICVGREGNTGDLNLEAAGVGLDERGRVWCDVRGQTWVPGIIAVGDVMGYPQSAGRSRTDGRALFAEAELV